MTCPKSLSALPGLNTPPSFSTLSMGHLLSSPQGGPCALDSPTTNLATPDVPANNPQPSSSSPRRPEPDSSRPTGCPSPQPAPEALPATPRIHGATWGEGEPRRAHAQTARFGPRLTWESRNSTTTFSLLHRVAIPSHRRPGPWTVPSHPSDPRPPGSVSPAQPTSQP